MNVPPGLPWCMGGRRRHVPLTHQSLPVGILVTTTTMEGGLWVPMRGQVLLPVEHTEHNVLPASRESKVSIRMGWPRRWRDAGLEWDT